MGRWSRPVAREFLEWLGVPRHRDWVDVGCGTGALSGAILEAAEPSELAGVDPSEAFIAAAKLRLGDGPDLRVGDAQWLPFADQQFDAAVSGLALNFVPDPALAVAELRRVTKVGGMVAAYVWDYAGGMQMIKSFWDVVVAMDPLSSHLHEATLFPLCDPLRLEILFRDAGLVGAAVTGLEIPTIFKGFHDFWDPLLGGQGPAPSYVMSLTEEDRHRLRSALLESLPEIDGRIALTARAWAVKALR